MQPEDSGSGKINAQPNFFFKIISDEPISPSPSRFFGTGMTKNERINKLGITEKIGTKAFKESMAAGGNISMNDQFGASFYSSYFVSDKIHIGISTTMTSTDTVSKE